MRYETTSKREPREVLSLARDYFTNEWGLAEQPGTNTTVRFQGGGGGVSVTAVVRGGSTHVEIIAAEWDRQARQFLSRLAGRG